jgi:hypothetical protein
VRPHGIRGQLQCHSQLRGGAVFSLQQSENLAAGAFEQSLSPFLRFHQNSNEAIKLKYILTYHLILFWIVGSPQPQGPSTKNQRKPTLMDKAKGGKYESNPQVTQNGSSAFSGVIRDRGTNFDNFWCRFS